MNFYEQRPFHSGGTKNTVITNPPYCQLQSNREQEEKLKKINEELLKAKCSLLNTQPPSSAEIARKRQELNLVPSVIHIAVAGCTGQGRSTLVDAMNSWYATEPSTNILAWHDVPGAGAPGTSKVNYFYNVYLYAYDLIIILMASRCTDVDLGTAKMCHDCGIPYIFVRTRSDQLKMDLVSESTWPRPHDRLLVARQDILNNLNDQLLSLKLPRAVSQQSYFLVNARTLKALTAGKKWSDKLQDLVDENALLQYLLTVVKRKQDSLAPLHPTYCTATQDHNRQTISSQAAIISNTQPPVSACRGSVRMAVIGDDSSFFDTMRTATSYSTIHTLQSIQWSFIEYPQITEMKLTDFLPDESLIDLRAAVILMDDWITELHTYSARRCGQLKVPCLFVQSKSIDVLEEIMRKRGGGIDEYKEDLESRFDVFRKQLKLPPKKVDVRLPVYVISDITLLLTALNIEEYSQEKLLLDFLSSRAAEVK